MNIAIVERQPVYVLGLVRSPGVFKHTPGMIVLQALAQAGGTDQSAADTSKVIESIREGQRLRQAIERYDRLLIRQARITAQRDNSDTILLPPRIRSRLEREATIEGIAAVVALEEATLAAERKAYQYRLSLARRQVEVAQIEIDAQLRRADQLKELSAKKTERLRSLEQIAARGSVSTYKLSEVDVEIAEVAARLGDVRVAVAQANRRMIEAQDGESRLEQDLSFAVMREAAATAQEIQDCAYSIASMKAVTDVLRSDRPGSGASATLPGIRITRRGPNGFAVMTPTATTPVVPGDVIQVYAPDRPDQQSFVQAGQTQNLATQNISR